MDLPFTTDFRPVIASLTQSQLGIEDHARVFPGFDAGALPIVNT